MYVYLDTYACKQTSISTERSDLLGLDSQFRARPNLAPAAGDSGFVGGLMASRG